MEKTDAWVSEGCVGTQVGFRSSPGAGEGDREISRVLSLYLMIISTGSDPTSPTAGSAAKAKRDGNL